MKFRPTACWRMRTSPGPGAATSTASYTRASGPPTLCTRTALTITLSPSVSASSAPARGGAKAIKAVLSTRGGLNPLFDDFFAIAPGQHVEQFDRGCEHDGKIDVAARDVEFE